MNDALVITISTLPCPGWLVAVGLAFGFAFFVRATLDAGAFVVWYLVPI